MYTRSPTEPGPSGPGRGLPAGAVAEAHSQEPAHLYDLLVRARQETTCKRPPERPRQLLPSPLKPLQLAGHPAVRIPSETHDPRVPPGLPAGDLPHRPCRGRTAAATHLARQQEPFSKGGKEGEAAGGSGVG